MLFGKKADLPFDKEAILSELIKLRIKTRVLENKFSYKGNDVLALSCKKYLKDLKECSDLVAQMLPPRDKHKAKLFARKSKEYLRKTRDLLQECEEFEYPIKNGTVEQIINDLKTLILDITSV